MARTKTAKPAAKPATKPATEPAATKPATEPLVLVAELGSSVLKHADGEIRVVRVTPDGKRILSAGAGAHVWDASTGERVADLAVDGRNAYSLAISPEGTRVFVGGNGAQIFELATQHVLATLAVGKPLVVAAAFGPANSLVFGDDRNARRFDAGGVELAPLKGHRSRIDALAISLDGRRALTCGGDRKIKLHALDGKQPAVIATWDGSAKSCGFSPDGTRAWSVGWSAATVRDTTTGKPTFELELEDMRSGAMSADGALFAVATAQAVHVYAPPGKTEVAHLAFAAATLAFTPDGKRLVAAGDASGICVFDLEGEQRVLPGDAGHTAAIEDLAIAAHAPHVLFSAGADGRIVMWDLETGVAIERIASTTSRGQTLACTADGKTLVTSSSGGVTAWHVARTERVELPEGAHPGMGVALSPDGRHVAHLVCRPRSVAVYELATRKLVSQTTGTRAHHEGAITFLTDDVVLSVSTNGTAVATQIPSGARLWEEAADGFITTLCTAGDAVVVGTSNGSLVVWDAATGTQRAVVRESGRSIRRACLAGVDHVAILQGAGTPRSSMIEVWRLSARALVGSAVLDVEAGSITASPDGRRIYVGTNTSRILVFERGK